MSFTLDVLLLATGWTHVLLAPYTKVEESFNLHATHDVLMYGVRPAALHNYDHFVFPGAVPRTFIGSVLLAWLSTPVIHLANWLGLLSTKFDLQIIIRLVLATLNAMSLCLLRRAVSRRFGRPTGLFFTILTCSQFHIPFWMGRTLPNMFALFPVNISSYLLLSRAPNSTRPSPKSLNTAIALLTFAAVVFRAEVLLLLGPLVLQSLILRHATLSSVIKTGIISGLASLALTTLVDSYFWDTYPLWPEFSGIYFNVFEGKSSDWGVSPPLTYIKSHLPKLLLSSLPLSLLGTLLDLRIRTLLFPSFAFIALISCLGHKEWRFIVYTVPLFNVAAARGATWMSSRRKGSIHGRILFLLTALAILSNILITTLLTTASIANYPGGQALSQFNQNFPPSKSSQTQVHISNLAAQTGASLFLQIHSPPYLPYLATASPSPPNIIYNKTESLTLHSLTTSKYLTHLIAESPPTAAVLRDWNVVKVVEGFDRWAVDWDFFRGVVSGRMGVLTRVGDVLRMVKGDKLWILERKELGTWHVVRATTFGRDL